MAAMTLRPHSFDVSADRARQIQQAFKAEVITRDHFKPVRRVAGIDVYADPATATLTAAVAVLGFPDLSLQTSAFAKGPAAFPYTPGLLAFRELPVVLKALAQITHPPDLVICDGQGQAHPRQFGLACHLGVLTGLPCIGAAKTRLVGTHDPVGETKGSRVPLMDGRETIGTVLRTRTGVKPLYVSIGHKISLGTASDFVLRCVTRFRLPETTRLAHRLARDHRGCARNSA